MRRLLDKLADRMELVGLTGAVLARIDGIGVADVRWRDDSRELFRDTIQASLRLIQEHDPRRYQRVRRHLKWIINCVTTTGACYQHGIQACKLQFDDFRDISAYFHVAFHACAIIHEATHGFIQCRGIAYDEKNRMQVERICMAEQNRFAAKLAAVDPERYPPRLLHFSFDAQDWNKAWTAGPWQWRRAYIKRWLVDTKVEPDAAPDHRPVG